MSCRVSAWQAGADYDERLEGHWPQGSKHAQVFSHPAFESNTKLKVLNILHSTCELWYAWYLQSIIAM